MMNYQDKTKVELIKELDELRHEYDSLKTSYERETTELKQFEERLLLKSEIISNMSEAISLIRMADGIFIYVHPHFEKMFGYKQDEMLGKHVSILNAPTEKSPKQTAKEIMDYLNKNGFWKGEVENIRKDGTFFTCYASVTIFDHSKFGKVCVSIHTDITEHKKVQIALHASEEHYKTLFNSIDEGFCIIEVIFDEKERPIDYRFLEVNPSFEKQTGLKDAQGKRMRELKPKHEEHWFEIYGKIALTGKPVRFEKQAEQLNRWYDVYAFRVGRPENRQVAILFNDISGRKVIEEMLRQNQARLEVALSPIDMAVFNQDINLRYTWMFKPQLGYTTEQVIGKTDADLLPPEADTQITQIKRRVLENGTGENEDVEVTFEGRTITYHLVVEPLRNALGHVVGITGSSLDITERKKVEEKLVKSDNLLRTVLNNAPISMFATDDKGVILLHEGKVLEKVGMKPGENVGVSIYDLFSDLKVLGHNGKVTNGKSVLTRVLNGKSLSGYTEINGIYFDNQFVPFFNLNKQVTGFIGVATDITAHKKIEIELRNSKELLEKLFSHQNEIREEERSLISREIHDQLGQSLTALKLDLNQINKYLNANPEAVTKLKSMVELISDTIKDVQRISSDLRPGILDDLGLAAAIEWYSEEFENRTGIKCKLSLDTSILGDSQKDLVFFRVLQEALTNVIRHASASSVRIRLSQLKHGIVMSIHDNGIGMLPGIEKSGKSLGLIGMRERVRQYGGKIYISSKKGEGTKLKIFIPSK